MQLKNLSMKWRIILPVASIVALLFVISASFTSWSMKSSLMKESGERALAVAARHSLEISSFIDSTNASLEALKQASLQFKKLGPQGRELLSQSLKQTLALHPQSVGIWFFALPNSFDKADAQQVGSKIADSTGRLNIWWTQDKGVIALSWQQRFSLGLQWHLPVTP